MRSKFKFYLELAVVLFIVFMLGRSTRAEYHCINQGYDLPKIKFRGEDHYTTLEKTIKMCFSLRVQQYISVRGGTPSTERQIWFVEDCTNKSRCVKVGK